MYLDKNVLSKNLFEIFTPYIILKFYFLIII